MGTDQETDVAQLGDLDAGARAQVAGYLRLTFANEVKDRIRDDTTV